MNAEPAQDMNVLVGQGKEAIVRATHRFFDEAAFQREVVQEISIDQVCIPANHVLIQIGCSYDHRYCVADE